MGNKLSPGVLSFTKKPRKLLKAKNNILKKLLKTKITYLKEWPHQYQFLSIWNFEVLAGHRSLEEKFSLILEIFLFPFFWVLYYKCPVNTRGFSFFSNAIGAPENMRTWFLVNQIQISCVQKTAFSARAKQFQFSLKCNFVKIVLQ